ncbi:MAG: cytochrome [Flaviaesturariibacter sp.]|nr:cytochrome [Flaviaesturariibacter sp.]
MKIVKRILLALLVVFILIQFIRPKENRHEGPQQASVLNRYPASPEVRAILEKACNDCHSNNTKYPWYNRVQPVAWWLNDHIEEGKRGLNFDSFLVYAPKRQARRMEQTIGMVKKGVMPLKSYTWIHKDAILTPAEKAALAGWADSVRQAVLAGGI